MGTQSCWRCPFFRQCHQLHSQWIQINLASLLHQISWHDLMVWILALLSWTHCNSHIRLTHTATFMAKKCMCLRFLCSKTLKGTALGMSWWHLYIYLGFRSGFSKYKTRSNMKWNLEPVFKGQGQCIFWSNCAGLQYDCTSGVMHGCFIVKISSGNSSTLSFPAQVLISDQHNRPGYIFLFICEDSLFFIMGEQVHKHKGYNHYLPLGRWLNHSNQIRKSFDLHWLQGRSILFTWNFLISNKHVLKWLLFGTRKTVWFKVILLL